MMFGKLKRRWRRFLFYSQVHHPVFFGVAEFCKFPAQVALLVGTLWALVGWYISFMDNSPTLTAASQQIAQSSTPERPAATDNPASNDSGSSSTSAKPPTATQIVRTAKTQAETNSESVSPVPSVTIETAAGQTDTQLNQTSASGATPTTLPVRSAAAVHSAAIVGADWVLQQERGFVVQISTSTQPVKLHAMARQFGEIKPVAVYPFSKTATGQQLYGLSVGYYQSYLAASEGFKTMPKEVQVSKPWIRSVRELQQAIDATDDSNIADVE